MIPVTIASTILLILMFLGMPVALSFLASSILYYLLSGESLSRIVPTAFYSLNNFTLLALPLFIIAGNIMQESGIAERLINFSELLLRKIKGGLGAIIPLASMLFGAICGSGTATVAALGEILLPKLTERGWDKRYVCALIAASGPLGFMIPPNINAILFAYVSDTSVAALFLATIIPGILWGLLYILTNRVIYLKYNPNLNKDQVSFKLKNTKKNETNTKQNRPWDEFMISLKETFPAMVMMLIIFGGIYGGIFTPTEAGAVSVIYALLVGVLIYKTMNFRNSFQSFTRTATLLGSFMIIFPMVNIFSRILVLNGVPQAIAVALTAITQNKNMILFLMATVYFICGFFLPVGVLVMIITPLLLPSARFIDLNLIQMGSILMVSIGIGTLTPPMAMNLYVASDISGVEIHEMVGPLIPYIIVSIPILLLVTYVPAVSLWLPKIIMGLPY